MYISRRICGLPIYIWPVWRQKSFIFSAIFEACLYIYPAYIYLAYIYILQHPPQLFLSINLMSWNFYMIFWDVILEWYATPNISYRRWQLPSTLFRGLWNMVDFPNIVKITTIFQNCFLSRKIRDLRTHSPGAKKFLNFPKNRFISSESIFEVFMAHREICDICK